MFDFNSGVFISNLLYIFNETTYPDIVKENLIRHLNNFVTLKNQLCTLKISPHYDPKLLPEEVTDNIKSYIY